MTQRLKKNLLGAFDSFMAFIAILTGLMMISNSGVFSEYPKEWITKFPFETWIIPGVIAIVLFGMGNIIAAIFSFRKENGMSWLMSAIMGVIFFICIVVQVMILGEWYLATVEFLVFDLIQLILSRYTAANNKGSLN